jgi:hypothetical protein
MIYKTEQQIKKINKINNKVKEFVKNIDELEIDIIKKNNINERNINLYKLMLENIILEHHEACKKIIK